VLSNKETDRTLAFTPSKSTYSTSTSLTCDGEVKTG